MEPKKKRNSSEETLRKKRLAYILYVDNRFEQKEISRIIGISEQTICRWKKEGAWEEDREADAMGPQKIIRRINKRYDKLLTSIESRPEGEDFPNSKEADILNKLADSVKKLQVEILHGHKTEVGKQFITYMQKTYGQAKSIEFVDYWHEYLMSTS